MADNAIPKPRRAARYTEHESTLVTLDMRQAITADVERESAKLGKKVSRATIVRRYLEAGRAITDAAERAAAD